MNLDVGMPSLDALNRNIVKVLTISGTVGSNDVNQSIDLQWYFET